ncbi:MAG: hypothetical protein KF799_01815 [Bdellovibrionales bacterium]|nr:hypothetical protein [Bdellovibrionales bacterium]
MLKTLILASALALAAQAGAEPLYVPHAQARNAEARGTLYFRALVAIIGCAPDGGAVVANMTIGAPEDDIVSTLDYCKGEEACFHTYARRIPQDFHALVNASGFRMERILDPEMLTEKVSSSADLYDRALARVEPEIRRLVSSFAALKKWPTFTYNVILTHETDVQSCVPSTGTKIK